MNAYTAAMLAVLVLNVAVQLWLLSRQVAHVQSHRNRVPVWFQGTVRLLAHRRAALYTAAKARLAQLEILVNAALLLAWTLGGGLEWLDQTWRGVGVGELWSGVGFAVSAAALMSVKRSPSLR